jgi:xanthine/uracil permease
MITTKIPDRNNDLAGGQGAKDYGNPKNLILGGVTLIVILLLQRFTTTTLPVTTGGKNLTK